MSYIGNEPTSVAFLTDTFSGNGSTTAFTLSAAPAGTSSILVAITGVVQDPSTYSVVGTTLTFSPAPPTGTGNISVRFLGIPASGVTTTAYRTVTEFTATAGQTTFNVPSYTVGFIDVYRNGVLLGSADYTASNGLTVVLASGATAGDLVEVISFSVSSVLNAIPGTAGSVGTTYLAGASVTQAKLGTNVAGNGPAFSAYASGTTSISAGTRAKVTFATEVFDTNSNFASSRFTPTVAGYYQINLSFQDTGTVTILQAELYKNGSSYVTGGYIGTAATFYIAAVSTLVYMNGTTDYLEGYCYSSATASVGGAAVATFFTGALVRAA
jgi:hypothetical protein